MTGLDIAIYLGGSLLTYWAVSVLLDDGGAAARKRREGGEPSGATATGVAGTPDLPATAPADTRAAGGEPPPESATGATGIPPGTDDAAPGVADGLPEPWYAVLGVREDASQARILAAYRELIMHEHPDPRVTLAPEQRARIEARLEQIEAACNAGLAARRT